MVKGPFSVSRGWEQVRASTKKLLVSNSIAKENMTALPLSGTHICLVKCPVNVIFPQQLVDNPVITTLTGEEEW